MEKKEIIALALGSAVIGAFFSAIITWFNGWRERVARERELLLTTAVDLSKTYMQRVSNASKSLGTLPELVVLGGMHRILKGIFHNGSVSQEDLDRMKRTTDGL